MYGLFLYPCNLFLDLTIMRRRWLRRWLGEMSETSLDTSVREHTNPKGRKAKLAMLIDTENVTPAYLDDVMRRAGKYGDVIHRLAFGPVKNGKWEKARLDHAIRLGRQSHVKTGKNSADIELTITAMELLNDEGISGFCIVSSDSDFTPLVMKLREAGRLVIGFGEKKTPEGFVDACDWFETIGEAKNANNKAGPKTNPQVPGMPKDEKAKRKQKSSPKPEVQPPTGGKAPVADKLRKEFLNLVKEAAKGAKNRDGWILTSVLGSKIRKMKPGIEYKNYGHRTLIGILSTYPDEIETMRENNADLIRVKQK